MFYIQISCISHLAGIFITIRKSVDECYIFYIYECCIFIAQIRRCSALKQTEIHTK